MKFDFWQGLPELPSGRCAHCDGTVVDEGTTRRCRHGVLCWACADQLDKFSGVVE